jgi:DNA-binding GntR family transcriptional regulator
VEAGVSTPGIAGKSAPRARGSLVQRAYAIIKERIQTNLYPPGFQALESELAAELEMSRTPVREALIRLRQEGLVDVQPRRGMRVLALSPHDMREIYEVIAGAEAIAVELLAERKLAAPELEGIEAEVATMERALEADDLEAWAEADSRFHRLLFELCANRRLAQVGISHLDQASRVRLFTLRLRRRPLRSTADHRRLVELLRAGDAMAARDLTLEHRRRATTELMQIIEHYHLRVL